MKTERILRNLTLDDIESYLEVYLNAYPAYKELDEACRDKYRKKVSIEITENKEVELLGLFEDDRMIAFMKIVNFSMNIYGRMQHVCGLMSLAVHPLHKKKGVAFEMVTHFEDYASDHGAQVTVLLPFRIDFYRNMGYGYGAKMDEYHVPTESLPKTDSMKGIHLLTMDDLPQVLDCHSRMAEKNHGMLKKFEEEIRGMREDTQIRRIGYFEEGKMKGYASYRFENTSPVNYTLNRMSVEELVYDEGVVLRKLLGALRMQSDLAQTVVLRTGEEDFYHLLESPQDISGNYINFGFLQTNVSAVGTMFKILNPAAFIASAAYRNLPEGNLTAEFIYEDMMAHCEKRIKISFADGRWRPEESERAADISLRCSQGDLSSLLLGSASLASLIRLGSVKISNETYAEQLNNLLYCSQKPWSNSDY